MGGEGKRGGVGYGSLFEWEGHIVNPHPEESLSSEKRGKGVVLGDSS